MKLKTTKKEIRQGYSKIIRVGYCDLQHLLTYRSPFAYSTRVEGWACDYYDVNGVCISTGYSPIGQKVDYDIIKKYDTMSIGKTCLEKEELLYQFIEEVFNK